LETVKLSYSSASKYKQCATKYFISKDYKTTDIYSSLIFGKAVEEGVSALLDGEPLDQAIERFIEFWAVENNGDPDTENDLYGNPDISFFNSDYDDILLKDDDKKVILKDCEDLLGVSKWEAEFAKLNASKKPLTTKQKSFVNIVYWHSMRRRGEIMIKAFNKQLLPKIEKVYEKQKIISLCNESGDEIIGFLDFIVKLKDVEGPVVLDLKTAARAYMMHALDTSEQLKVYLAGVFEEYKTLNAGYMVLLKKPKVVKTCDKCGAERPHKSLAKNCKSCGKGKYTINDFEGVTQLIYKTFEESEINGVLDDYLNICDAIRNGIKFKNPSNCFMYGNQCEFYDACWKGKDLHKLKHLVKKEKKS